MLSSRKVKIIQSLDKKKYRQKYDLFVVEGIKNIKEFKNTHYSLVSVYTTEAISFLPLNEYTLISYEELSKISFLKTPHNALALLQIPKSEILEVNGVQIALDNIQDPGNLGTIIRLADWFGIEQIVCNKETVDVYNPKVIQATMGSLSRVNVVYTCLEEFLLQANTPILGTDMNGSSIYKTSLPEKSILVMGNEGNGLSKSIEKLCTQMISIPRLGNKQEAESLNVAMATGIILGEFFSQENR